MAASRSRIRRCSSSSSVFPNLTVDEVVGEATNHLASHSSAIVPRAAAVVVFQRRLTVPTDLASSTSLEPCVVLRKISGGKKAAAVACDPGRAAQGMLPLSAAAPPPPPPPVSDASWDAAGLAAAASSAAEAK